MPHEHLHKIVCKGIEIIYNQKLLQALSHIKQKSHPNFRVWVALNKSLFHNSKKSNYQADTSSLTDIAILNSNVSTRNPVAYTPNVIIISGTVGTYSFT